jgi:hypothetical protein
MTGWDDLNRELDRWETAGKKATLWWRDDDARDVTPALEDLLTLAERHRLPLALAVVPEGATAALAERLGRASTEITVLQHGIAHENRAEPGAKKQELMAGGDLETLCRRLSEGCQHLEKLFGSSFLPVLVPPWNRIDAQITAELPALGYIGLSAFGWLQRTTEAGKLTRLDCYLDIFDWKPERRFRGGEALLADLTAQLAARRGDSCPTETPLGIMTHHLVHDRRCWRFLDRLYSLLTNHPGVRFLSGADAFARRNDKTDPAAAAQGGES